LIENVVTHPDHRRTGLGRAVLSFALDAAWKRGKRAATRSCWQTDSRREETLHFYEGAGFDRGGKTFFEAHPTVPV
jgi:GNAT superfamily N-acetyltransferase